MLPAEIDGAGILAAILPGRGAVLDEATRSFLSLLGGVALLLYGMRIAGEALQQVAGTRLRGCWAR